MLTTVLNHALVLFSPYFFEQRALGCDVGVGIQNQHFRLGLKRLEIPRHHRRPLIWAGRAAVRRLRNRDRKHTAIGHGLQLLAQCDGLRASLPGLQNLAAGVGCLKAFHTAKHQINTGRDDQFVVGNHTAAAQRHGFFGGVNVVGKVFDDGDAVVFSQARVRSGHVINLLDAANHQVRHGARDECALRLNQHHVNFVVRQQANVLGRRCAAVAAADDHHFGSGRHAGHAGAA